MRPTHRWLRRSASAVATTTLLISALLSTPSIAQVDVWIDPGHGGHDSGAEGINGPAVPNEKNLTLQVASVLQSRLAQIGWLSLMTRNSDIYWTKTRRTLIAAGQRPNDLGDTEMGTCCVSVHMNGVPDSTTFGTQVIHPATKAFSRWRRGYYPDSLMGRDIYNALMTNTSAAFMGCNSGEGMKKDVRELTVLLKSQIPTVIVECCYISNRCQFTKIQQAGNQALVANGIATGISVFLSLSPQQGPSRAAPTSPRGAPYTIATPPAARLAAALAATSEGFEGGTFPPPGWTITGSGSPQPYAWHLTTDSVYVNSGAGSATVRGESPGAVDERLISPMFRVAASDSSLKFYWLGNPRFAASVDASCSVRRKGEATWTTVWSLSPEAFGTAFHFTERVASLAAWLGDSIQISFRVNGANGADFAVDDIATGVFPRTGPPSNDLCSNPATLPAGTFVLMGTTCYAGNESDPYVEGIATCVPDEAGGGDVFYQLAAQAGDTLKVEAQSGTFRPHLYLLDACGGSATCLVGNGPNEDENASQFSYVFGSSGTRYLVVDGLPDECGTFAITGTFRGSVTGVDGPSPSPGTGLRVAVAPNPARAPLQFLVTGARELDGPARLKIFDASGRKVYERSVPFSAGETHVSWDRRTSSGALVAPGIYMAVFEVRGIVSHARVTVLD
jgi:N-acetylmuramoyl-L-alanine amidase